MSRLVYLLIVFLAFSSSGALAVVPGGLVLSHNDGTGTATSMEVTITVEAAPPDSSSYFFAQQFYTSTTVDHGGYFGLQTGGVIGAQNVGKILIFSIWNADQAEAGPGAVAQTFGGEGVGYSVRMPFQWSQGISYRFRLEKDGSLWWKLTVADPVHGTIYLGRIRITQDVPLQPLFAAFTEYFRSLPTCTDLPSLEVSFADLMFGSTLLPVVDSFPYGPCASEARGKIRGNAAVHEVRPPEDYYTVTPCRLLDTRIMGQGPALTTGNRELVVPPNCGIPVDALAVALNVTAVSATVGGHVTVYPGGTADPGTSTINFSAGQTRANNLMVGLAPDFSGKLILRAVVPGGEVHFLVDVVGYF